MRLLGALTLAFSTAHAVAAAPAGYFDFATGTVLEAGDTWVSAGKRYRLYGLQSCVRGTSYTDMRGNRRDCGDASIAVLVKDTSPVCALVAGHTDMTFAVCYASVGGQRLDLAMVMIAQGYGFASLDREGRPISVAYAVAEQNARAARRGLWQFDDVQHPAILLSRVARNRGVSP
ncbi:thermonuclease family protein [Pararhizobium sp. PWRC1-1]|uniref:thermonuclease family protein n=1 Tax=Pararhizobium sp. PWRC1-1 TaxID=2804566 RepID=UPI003CEF415C